MDALILSRWQFAITTVYHFFFVPLTLGLSILVAIMESIYVRTGDEDYKRMTKFGQVIPDQLCHGGGDRDCSGISVWYELV